MEWYWVLSLFLGSLVALLMVGLPVAIAFLAINIVGAMIFLGGEPGLALMVRNTVDAVASFPLTPIPLFLLMGEIMFHTGLAHAAIDAVERLIARVPGRLSLVAIAGGTIFSSLSGSSLANTAMLGSTLMPEMRRRGYHSSMSIGPILGTGGLAMLIPPSALAVILASLAEMSVADLLIACVIPGLVMAVMFAIYVIGRCMLQPHLAPRDAVEHMGFWERVGPFLTRVLPLMLIFIVVVGSILAGYASPTESAALGCAAALLAALLYGKLTLRALLVSIDQTARISVMILFIICASITFSQILSFSGAADGLLALIRDAGLSKYALLACMILTLIVLGCFMDQLSMMMITVPFFVPMIGLAGIDPIWFGVMMLIALEMGFTTPPFGLLLFVMKGVAPPDVTMKQIIHAAIPFIIMQFLTILLIMAIPDLALWLPAMIER